MAEAPPTKKLKQSKLTCAASPATQLDLSTPSTSHPVPVQEDTADDPDEENTCTSECCARACDEQGPSPFQPKDSKTIERTRRKQGQKSRLFSPAWYVTYPWITLCTTRARVFCVYCRYCMGKGLSLAKKEEAFVTTGFDNWKKAHQRFYQHIQSVLHKESILKIELLKQDSVSSLLNKQAMAEQEQH